LELIQLAWKKIGVTKTLQIFLYNFRVFGASGVFGPGFFLARKFSKKISNFSLPYQESTPIFFTSNFFYTPIYSDSNLSPVSEFTRLFKSISHKSDVLYPLPPHVKHDWYNPDPQMFHLGVVHLGGGGKSPPISKGTGPIYHAPRPKYHVYMHYMCLFAWDGCI
jgi:hypothetical protein